MKTIRLHCIKEKVENYSDDQEDIELISDHEFFFIMPRIEYQDKEIQIYQNESDEEDIENDYNYHQN